MWLMYCIFGIVPITIVIFAQGWLELDTMIKDKKCPSFILVPKPVLSLPLSHIRRNYVHSNHLQLDIVT